MRAATTATVVVALAACGGGGGGGATDGSATGEVDVARGQELFENTCAVCHGTDALGTPAGPPLVHEIYGPEHHSDEDFQRAVLEGVEPHDWDQGPMPRIGGLDRADVADMTAWIRQEQRDAGIH